MITSPYQNIGIAVRGQSVVDLRIFDIGGRFAIDTGGGDVGGNSNILAASTAYSNGALLLETGRSHNQTTGTFRLLFLAMTAKTRRHTPDIDRTGTTLTGRGEIRLTHLIL